VPPRFLLLSDVAETLNVSHVQARALVTSGELPAIQVGGRGQWRVEVSELEAYIQRKYAEARAKTGARQTAGPQPRDPGTDDPSDGTVREGSVADRGV
jgi:excisionase family DNA binding protein